MRYIRYCNIITVCVFLKNTASSDDERNEMESRLDGLQISVNTLQKQYTELQKAVEQIR